MSSNAQSVITETYHDRVVTVLVMCSVFWSVLGMVVGVYIAAELIWPTIDFGQQWLSFGRLRTLHTNVLIFGFAVSALMGTAFYTVQRTCHVPLFAPGLISNPLDISLPTGEMVRCPLLEIVLTIRRLDYWWRC